MLTASRTTSRASAAPVAAVCSPSVSLQPLCPHHHAPVQPSCAPSQPCFTVTVQTRRRQSVCAAAAAVPKASNSSPENTGAPVPSTENGKLISKTEVAAFIQRDDLMDQMYRWAIIEAGEAGVRNFGMPMDVSPFYKQLGEDKVLWGYQVGIYKEGDKRCDLGIMFDQEEVPKHEWVGRGDDGFPLLEGKVDMVIGKHFEIWKLCTRPVDEELRKAIRAFCTQLVIALNRYYAFGSVFVDDAQ